jgi:hypothetical protein
MAITSQNTNLNQFVPPMCVHAPVAGQTFLYNSAKRVWENKTIEAADLGGIAPEDLIWLNGFGPGDVVTISEDLTTFVSTPRSALSGPGAATSLNDLADVAIVSPILTNTVLTYNGTVWTDGYVSYDDLTNVPTEFIPSAHTHTVTEITDLDTYYYDKLEVDSFLNTKANVVAGIANNFSMLDGLGQLADSGYSAGSFATAAQGVLADTALQTGSNISRLINNAGYITGISAFSINALSDVNTASAADGQVLRYNGTEWVASNAIDINTVTSVFARTGDVIATLGDYNADQITYNNVTSSLTATTVQAAIDELEITVSANTADIADNAADIATNAADIADNTADIATNTANIATNTANITTLQNAGFLTNINAQSINELIDVDTTGVANNFILSWDTNKFIVLNNTFLAQTDTPSNYIGSAGKLVAVNTAETSLEFIDVIDGGAY